MIFEWTPYFYGTGRLIAADPIIVWSYGAVGGDSGSNIGKIAIGRDSLDTGQAVIGSVMGLSIN